MAKSKIRILLFPSPFFGGKGERVGCYPNCKGGIDSRISCDYLWRSVQSNFSCMAVSRNIIAPINMSPRRILRRRNVRPLS